MYAYLRYSDINKTLANGARLADIIRGSIQTISSGAMARTATPSLAVAFHSALNAEILRTYDAGRRVFLPVPIEKEKATAEHGAEIVEASVRDFVRQWGARVITPQIIFAWDKLTGASASADYNGKTKSKTETNAEGTSEQQASGTQAQKFASGLNTASAGTAVKNENTESTEGLTTGKTTTETEQEYAYEYAGNPTEFININAGRGVITKIVDSLYASCIDEEDLYPWEMLSIEEVKA